MDYVYLGGFTDLQNNINKDESRIKELFLKIELTNSYDKITKSIKDKYNELRNNYYGERLTLSKSQDKSLQDNFIINSAPRYVVDIETDVLQPLEELVVLANCKQMINSFKNGTKFSFEDVKDLIESYISSSNRYPKEKEKLKDEISSMLYELIKKEGENNTFTILDMVNEYETKGHSFVRKIKELYLEEVSELFKDDKSEEAFEMVKNAINDVFNQDDITALLKAKGIKLKEATKSNTVEFSTETEYKVLSYTDRIVLFNNNGYMTLTSFIKSTPIMTNPLPKTKAANNKLRRYDLTRINYAKIKDKDGDYVDSHVCVEYVDLSGTNAVIVPKMLDKPSIRGANLEGVDMRGVDLEDVDINDANLAGTGADIKNSKGKCREVSPYVDNRVKVSDHIITPEEFEAITRIDPTDAIYTPEKAKPFFNLYLWNNRALRQYDLSCIHYTFEYLLREYKKHSGYTFKYNGETIKFGGFDYSYTNIDFDPQEFTEALVLNLEGVDLRGKNFDGVEQFFAKCNLKGTGANISPKINPTVSEYVVPSMSKTR